MKCRGGDGRERGHQDPKCCLPTEADPWAKSARGAGTKDGLENLRVGGGCRGAKGEQTNSFRSALRTTGGGLRSTVMVLHVMSI